MKRIVCLALVFMLCLSLCACNNQEEANRTETKQTEAIQTETIQLDLENFEDYFYVEIETSNFRVESGSLLGTYYENGYVDCKVTIRQKVPGTVENVSATVYIRTMDFPWYGEETKANVTLNVSIDGNASKTIPFKVSAYSVPGQIEEPEYYGTVIDASGTIEIKK